LSEPDTLLSVERVQALPIAQQSGWLAYLARSAELHERDARQVQDEVQRMGLSAWSPAPAGPDFRMTSEMTGAWLASPAAHQLADAIISFQTPSGGWSKAVDYTRPRALGHSYASATTWSWIATFDNGATTEQMRLLGAVTTAQADSSQRAAFAAALDYIATAQFPNGCWPQVYPLEGSYHDAATFNDHIATRILMLLRAVSAGAYPFTTQAERTRAQLAIDRAVACIVAAQVTVAGRKTVWGQQHDPITLRPVKGRSYEPAALCSLESAGLVDRLIDVPAPSPAVVSAVQAAVSWLRERAIYGYRYDARGELIAQQGAGPLWARFYQIGTNRPIFSDRDGVIRYDLREVGEERRGGYAWYVDAPAATLARYEAWQQTHSSVLVP
jgi:PelA/Pel-15E family pectate lyase